MSKTAFIFPGQASQYPGMGKDFYEKYDIARKYYDMANEILGFDIKTISFSGGDEELKQTRNTQPAVFVLSVIIHELLKLKNIIPDFAAGHSLGEYAALTAAGVISFTDALEIVKLRSAEMQRAGEKNPGIMAAVVGLGSDEVIRICTASGSAGIVQAANFNSPVQTVISGSIEGVHCAMKAAKEAGALIVKELDVSGAFHSPLMHSAFEPLKKELQKRTFKDADFDVVPNVTAIAERSGSVLRELLAQQLTSPVKWSESIEFMISKGVTRFVETGPGKVLKGLVRSISKGVTVTCVGTVEELENINGSN